MTEQTSTATVPEWDVADRMRKALRESGLAVQEMADYLGTSRNSVGNWTNGRVSPSVQTLRLWALKCGVPFEWLRDGTASPSRPGGASTVRYRLPARGVPRMTRRSAPRLGIAV